MRTKTHRRQRPPALQCVWTAVVFAGLASGVIVDRVAVVVGDKIITQSEIEQRIRLTALQNHEKPDFSAETRRKTAEQLIDQKLVEREMEVGRYPRIDEDHKKALLADFEKSEPGLAQMLKSYGLTAQDLEDDLGRQADLLTFLNLRFRPAVQVTDQDALSNQLADKELDRWLQDQRKRTRIEYRGAK